MKTLSRHNGNHEKIRVLFYHRIGPDSERRDPCGITIPQSTFRRQLALLEKWGYSTITFQDYELYLEGALTLPRKPVIITFDDGYHDLHTYALPVMKEFGMTGVIFVVGDRQMRTNQWDQGLTPTYQLLSDEEILEFHASGFEIGAHSMHHRPLTEIGGSEAWEELQKARIATEILLNAPVTTFSYPYGLLNSELKQMASDAGYSVACAAYTGPPLFGEDVLEVRRIKMVASANPAAFWLKLQPAYAYYRCAWWHAKTFTLRLARRLAQAGRSSRTRTDGAPRPIPAVLRHAYHRLPQQQPAIRIVTSEETRS